MSSPHSTTLRQLRHLDESSPNFHDQLTSVLSGEEYEQSVPNLRNNDLVFLVDYLDKALDILNPASSGFRKCLRELRNICGTRTILPTSYIFSPSVLDIGHHPFASGGSGDIYEGSHNGLRVCVKRVRVYSQDDPEKAIKTLYQAAVLWKHLEHKNIVPLLGMTSTPLQLISEWMPGGDLTEYIKKCPSTDRLGLLRDITDGLYYLHSRNVVHGDLKGPNVLVDATGRAQITDFGLTMVTQNQDTVRSALGDRGNTARWTAPEILSEQGTYSKEADVFSFAMVMIEVFTGAVPFGNSLPAVALLAIMGGNRPRRPTHPTFTDELWILMQRCWDQDPHTRPEVSEVLKLLHGSDPQLLESRSNLVRGNEEGSSRPGVRRNDFEASLDTTQEGYYSNRSSRDPFRHSMVEGTRDGGGSWLGLQNASDETWSRRKTSGVNAGYTTKDSYRHDLQIGSKSSNQSRMDVGETLEDREPPFPQKYWDRRETLQEPKKYTRASYPQMRGGPRDNQERDISNDLGSALDQSSPPAWKRLISGTLTMEERVSLIVQIFSDRDQVEIIKNLSGDDAQTFVDMMDQALDRLPPEIRKKCSRSIHVICGRQALLPRSLAVPLCYDPAEDPLCHGGFADVWKGQHQGQEVAAKVLKVYKRNDIERVRRRFCKEVAGWKTLRHPNILPLLGVTMFENRLVMVSKWMVKGNINEFLKAEPNADRLGFLLDVTTGLIYMHDEGMVHGDLKGANILIDDNGCACLTDFSLLMVASDQSTVISSCIQGGTIQWMSPELIDPERFGLVESRPTKESDCYALGMVVYEVLSGQTPFAPSPLPPVIWKVLEGQRPGRPQGKGGALFTDDLWEVLGLCWKHKPDERTNAKVVLQCLERTSMLPRPSPDMDRIVEIDTDESLDAIVNDSGTTITPGGGWLPVPPRRMAITAPSTHAPPQNDSPAKADPHVETGPPAKADPPIELEPPVEEQSGCCCVIM